MLPLDARTRTTLRWGGAIAGLLGIQSLLLAGLFWLLAGGAQIRDAEHRFTADCRRFAALSGPARTQELRGELRRDIHRDRFLALFTPDGRRIAGNVAGLPRTLPDGQRSIIAPVTPTELPGKSSDVARLSVCAMPDGARLLTGVDLDDTEQALATVERVLLIGLLPALLLAVGFGLVAGRRAARQVDAVRRLAGRIVGGNLNGRLPVAEHPDSFGLLCASINTMLDRIELLIDEVRGVGDDIAHQIRTPLTRLRARLERLADPAQAAAALAEVDKVLGIVAALLRIRGDRGSCSPQPFRPCDAQSTGARRLRPPRTRRRGSRHGAVLRGRAGGDD